MDPNLRLRTELLADAEQMCRKIGASPTAILVSGDIAYAAHPDEYAFALTWFGDLASRCGTSLDSVFTVPGNHDVDRVAAQQPLTRLLHKDIKETSNAVALDSMIRGHLENVETRRLLYEPLGAYNAFAVRFGCSLLPPLRTVASKKLLIADGVSLNVYGLNSAFVSGNGDKERDLFVDPAYGSIVQEPCVANLVMCHHPFSWLRNGDALRDYFADEAVIHLFGHEHTSRFELNRDFVMLAAGAAHPERALPSWEPGYNLIELTIRSEETQRLLEVAIHIRAWQERPGRFHPRQDRDGSDVVRWQLRLDGCKSVAAVDQAAAPATNGNDQPSMATTATRGDPMKSLREISLRFFKLTFSQKSAIAGSLGLLEDDDAMVPDFERFRRVLERASDQGRLAELERAIALAERS